MLRNSRSLSKSFTVLLAVVLSGLVLDISLILGWTTPRASHPSRAFSSSSSTTLAMTNTNMNDFRVLGVCGGIGSGKSTACKLLVESCQCLAHIDADKVAHSVYAPGSQAVTDVVTEFGKEILVKDADPMEIDRKKLGAIVFAERSAMAKLEEIVWPHVKDRLVEQIETFKEEWRKDAASDKLPVVILEAAILLDAGWDDLLDGVWAVTVPPEASLQRLVETRGLTPKEAQKRIDAQESRRGIGNLDQEVQNGTVHCVISNTGSLEDLKTSLQKSLLDPKCWRN